MFNSSKLDKVSFLGILILCAALVGCNLSSQEIQSTSPTSSATVQLQETPTNTLPPTPTSPPPLVVFITPPGADAAQVEMLTIKLTSLAEQSGFRLETRETLAQSDLVENIRLVVAVFPYAEIVGLAASNSQIQFLAVGIPEIQTTDNLSAVGSLGDRPDRQGFLAGYLAAVITQDWRVGVISLSGVASGVAARQGFLNGGVFYCGLCRPVYPPYYQYPLYVDLPAGASQAEKLAAADVLINSAVKTVYLPSGVGDESLYEYLFQAGINVIGSGTPPGGNQNQWVATIQADLAGALEQVWSNLVNGQGGLNAEFSLLLSDVNSNLLSPGRQRLVEGVLRELLAGYIDTGVDPLTGAVR